MTALNPSAPALTAISGSVELETFLDEVAGLHDGVLKEALMLWRGYVDEEFWMHSHGDLHDAVLLFQTQRHEAPVVELRCRGLLTFRYRSRAELDADGEVDDNGRVTLWLAGRGADAKCMVVAEKMWYRVLGVDMLGRGPRLGSPTAFSGDLDM